MKIKPNYKIIIILLFTGLVTGWSFSLFTLKYINEDCSFQLFFHTLGLPIFLIHNLTLFFSYLLCNETLKNTFSCFGPNIVLISMILYALLFISVYLINFYLKRARKIQKGPIDFLSLTFRKFIIYILMIFTFLITFLNLNYSQPEECLKYKYFFQTITSIKAFTNNKFINNFLNVSVLLISTGVLVILYLFSCSIAYLINKYLKKSK